MYDVTLMWTGKEQTLVRKRPGGEKFELEQFDTIEVEETLAKSYLRIDARFVHVKNEEDKEIVKKEAKEKMKKEEKRQKEVDEIRKKKEEAEYKDKVERGIIKPKKEEEDEKKPLSQMNVEELRAECDLREITYTDKTTKKEMRELIELFDEENKSLEEKDLDELQKEIELRGMEGQDETREETIKRIKEYDEEHKDDVPDITDEEKKAKENKDDTQV